LGGAGLEQLTYDSTFDGLIPTTAGTRRK
jgi:hypothetical protein